MLPTRLYPQGWSYTGLRGIQTRTNLRKKAVAIATVDRSE